MKRNAILFLFVATWCAFTLCTPVSGFYANGEDAYQTEEAEFYLDPNDADALYRLDLQDLSEEKALDAHIISLIGNGDTLYLLSYADGASALLQFDTGSGTCTTLQQFDTLVTNLAMQDELLYYISDRRVLSYDTESGTTQSVLEEGNIDLIYLSGEQTLQYFSAADGGGYTQNTYFLDTQTSGASLLSSDSYTPRLTAPATNDPYYSTWNVFYQSNYGMVDSRGNKRGNCTCYAYGRSYENLGYEPTLCTGNAGTWYSYNRSNSFYPYGSRPRLGAVAVWSKTGGAGHVAVVEAIDGNTIVTSESGWNSFYFKTRTRNLNSSNLSAGSLYSFLGFIYVLGEDPSDSLNLGDDFYAHIVNSVLWRYVTNDGGEVSARSRNNALSQLWHFQRLQNGAYKITSVADGLCMEVTDSSARSGVRVRVAADNGGDAQQWHIRGAYGVYRLQARCTQRVLDIYEGSSAEGAYIDMWRENGTDAQGFEILKTSPPSRTPAPILTATVQTSGSRSTIRTTAQHISSGVLLLCGYQNGQLTVFQAQTCQENNTFTCQAEFDTLRLIAVGSLSSMQPLCEAYTIKNGSGARRT